MLQIYILSGAFMAKNGNLYRIGDNPPKENHKKKMTTMVAKGKRRCNFVGH
jgi:hypothetical protein